MFWLFFGLLVISLVTLPIVSLLAKARVRKYKARVYSPPSSRRVKTTAVEEAVDYASIAAGVEKILEPKIQLMVQREVERRFVDA